MAAPSYSEYNLCTLPIDRIVQMVDRAIAYFRQILDMPDFTPRSFRAGNWLFQATRTAAIVLAERGIRLDSSVFKGGLQQQHKLDYRRALKNGYYWTFADSVNVPEAEGILVELPIYHRWFHLENAYYQADDFRKKGGAAAGLSYQTKWQEQLHHLREFLRFRYPLKFHFYRIDLQTNFHSSRRYNNQRGPEGFEILQAYRGDRTYKRLGHI